MDSEKYNRQVELLCPTCGGSKFKSDGGEGAAVQMVTCASCGREMTKEAFIEENGENISAHLDELKKEVVKDVASEIRNTLRRSLSGSKHIKFK